MPQFGQITVAQASRLIGTPDCPAFLDVRLPEDLAADPRLIPTARPIAHGAIAQAADPANRAIVICNRGRKLSEGAAAVLRAKGMAAEVLEGGHLAWAEAGLPLVPQAALAGTELWVTRHRPKIDRIACPWLIRRFVNPSARFLFVAPAEVSSVAALFGATPFDIEGTAFSHRAEGCTFDAMIADFGLSHPALDRLALVVRAADTDRHDLSPQAAGLLALSVGLSRLYRDDLGQLEAGMGLYDALYRWARDGFDEGHDWPANRIGAAQ
ncbi:MAG: chromate resistance protein ChrB domain-containing protein [Paracoccaceae bacterium]